MRDSSTTTSYVATLGGVGLFICTVLVSQILQDKLDKKRRREEMILQMRQQYKMNRLRDRLSYTDLSDSMNTSARPSPARRHQQQWASNNTTATSSALAADEDAFDLIPKNGNWSHFEASNEDDFRSGTVTPTSTDEDEASSSSSSEAFLWTASQKRRLSDGGKKIMRPLGGHVERSVSEPNTKSWMGRFRQTVGLAGEIGATLSDEFSAFENVSLEEGGVDGGSNVKEQMAAQQQTLHVDRPTAYTMPPLPMRRSASTPDIKIAASHDDLFASSNHNARAQYNARIMPNKVVMVRHGQSEGNVNELLYSTTPDNAMRLTKLGWDQALKAGKILKQQVLTTGEPIHFIVSPYVRTVETFHGLVSAWCDPKEFDHIRDREKRLKAWYGRLLELGLTWHEDPRIREQDFGNYQVPEKIKQAKQERHRFGPFFYRFPHGESASDVFDRVSTFLDSLWRSFDLNKSRNYVLVTHGISIRVLLARYFRYSIDQFSLLANPKNCEMVVLGHDGAGKLQLEGRCELELGESDETGGKEVTGHTFHQRLRVLPKKFVHKLNVRVSYDDTFGPPHMVGYANEDVAEADIDHVLVEADVDDCELHTPPLSNFHREQSIGR